MKQQVNACRWKAILISSLFTLYTLPATAQIRPYAQGKVIKCTTRTKMYRTGSCIGSGRTYCSGSDYDCYCDALCLSIRDCCTDIYQLDYCGSSMIF